MTIQPDVSTFAGDPAVSDFENPRISDGALTFEQINGTMFVAITDANITFTPFNLSMINPHVVAGPALYQAG